MKTSVNYIGEQVDVANRFEGCYSILAQYTDTQAS